MMKDIPMPPIVTLVHYFALLIIFYMTGSMGGPKTLVLGAAIVVWIYSLVIVAIVNITNNLKSDS